MEVTTCIMGEKWAPILKGVTFGEQSSDI